MLKHSRYSLLALRMVVHFTCSQALLASWHTQHEPVQPESDTLIVYAVLVLHRITWHHTTPHHTTPHHTTPHHTTQHHTTPHNIPPHHTTPHHTTPHLTTLQYLTSHHITSHHITSHHITSHHITWHCMHKFAGLCRQRRLHGRSAACPACCHTSYRVSSKPCTPACLSWTTPLSSSAMHGVFSCLRWPLWTQHPQTRPPGQATTLWHVVTRHARSAV